MGNKMNVKINLSTDLEKETWPFQSTDLCEIMGRHGSDKGNKDLSRSHNYTTLYHRLFSELKNEKLNLFELGLGTNNTDVASSMGVSGTPGASIEGWSEFFPNAILYGADIDERILYETDRIKTFQCDQTKKSSIDKMWNNEELKDLEFDIIIEDGLHKPRAQICFFENSIHKVKSGGFYVIEDFKHGHPFQHMCNIFLNYQKSGRYTDLNVNLYQMPFTSKVHRKNRCNSLVVIQRT